MAPKVLMTLPSTGILVGGSIAPKVAEATLSSSISKGRRCLMRASSFALFFILALVAGPSWAYRDYFTPEQKAQLAKIQTVAIDSIALTDKGAIDAKPIAEVASRRLQELGYSIIQDRSKPHDVLFKVKCEQRKTWEGTTTAVADAESAKAPDAGVYAMQRLKERLEQYDFPVIVTAEWGQPDRLLKLLDQSDTSQIRKLKIISVLGEMEADEALPKLKEALKDKDLSKQATVALGNMGREGIPILVDILKHSKQPELQAAAAKGLGDLGNIHNDSSVIPPLLEMLDAPGVDITVQTEVAWALGRVPDRRSVKPLFELDKKLQKIRNDPPDPKIKKLKEAVFWAIKQVYTEDQYS